MNDSTKLVKVLLLSLALSLLILNDAAQTPDYGTNLWLEISSVTNGRVSLILHNTVYTQTGEVYEVWSKTNLAIPGWNIETDVWAVVNQNSTPFTVPMLDRTNLFIWARDWTGIDENSNGVPDWWEYEHPGVLPPVITAQPASQTVVQGNDVTFSVGVSSNSTIPLSYQWYFNETNVINGATNTSLTLTNVQTTNAGNYSVTVTNTEGGVTSSVVTLTVTSPTADSDYDGISDGQEIQDGTDPFNPDSVISARLGYWRFDDTNTWIGDAGQLPLLATNVFGVPSWSTNAALVDSANAAILSYRDVETNGNANINLRNGTIRFWFKPDWSSTNVGGTVPGGYGRLIEMGNYNPAFTNGWWALYLSADGNQMVFGSSTNGAGTTNLVASISWESNQWHQAVLTYTPTNSLLYLDGQLVTNGSGSIYFPNATERANGFRIGGDSSGGNQARGVFDELETFNYPLDATSIQANYQTAFNLDSDGDGLSNILENQLGLNPYGYNSPNGLTGGNGLQVFTPLK